MKRWDEEVMGRGCGLWNMVIGCSVWLVILVVYGGVLQKAKRTGGLF